MHAVAETSRSVRSRMSWCTVLGGLITIGLVALVWSELPSIRREMRLMKM